jgi:hypothetical protein
MSGESAWLRGASFDRDSLTSAWWERWPSTPLISYMLRDNRDGWVRFHSLPESKRYAEGESDYLELLRRHNTVLRELIEIADGQSELLVVTASWSNESEPAARDPKLLVAYPDATYWTSVNLENDGDSWDNVYVGQSRFTEGVPDSLLRLAADYETVA